MAIHYYKKKHVYSSGYDISYQYTCAYCGQINSGKQYESSSVEQEVSRQVSYNTKIMPEFTIDPELARSLNEKAEAQAFLDWHSKKDRCSKGDFGFLRSTGCQHCGKEQPWAYPGIRGVSHIAGGLLLIAGLSFLLWWSFFWNIEMDMGTFFDHLIPWMIRFLCVIGMLAGIGFIESGIKALRQYGPAKNKLRNTELPVVTFSELTSANEHVR